MENSFTGWGGNFSNIVNISFSMFDDPITEVDVFDKMIFYKYIWIDRCTL